MIIISPALHLIIFLRFSVYNLLKGTFNPFNPIMPKVHKSRSSRPEVFYKNGILREIHRKIRVPVSLFK